MKTISVDLKMESPPVKTFRRPGLFLSGFLLLLIFVIPLSQTGLEAYRGGWPHVMALFTESPTEENLRAFEKKLDDSSKN